MNLIDDKSFAEHLRVSKSIRNQLVKSVQGSEMPVNRSPSVSEGKPGVFQEGLLKYIDALEQQLFDMRVVLTTTLQHSTDVENQLTHKNDLITGMWRRYECIVNASGEWMGLVNAEYRLEAVNAAFCKARKKHRNRLLNAHVSSLWGRRVFNDQLKSLLDRALAGDDVRERLEYDDPDLGMRTLEVAFYPFPGRSKPVTHAVIIARDITERLLSETRLQAQDVLMAQVQDAVYILDRQFKIRYWNEGALRLFGWSEKEVIGKKVSALFFSRKDRSVFLEIVQKLSQSRVWEGEIRQNTRFGDPVIVRSVWTRQGSSDGLETILVTNSDVTEKREMEQQFLRSQRLESIGSLASSVAHDLNNVLSLFFMAVKALSPKLAGDAQAQTILGMLDNSAKRGVGLVRQILDFARGIDGEQLEVPIHQLVREISGMIKETFPKGITIFSRLPREEKMVYGNPTQLHQVLLNLALNARDAMPSGGRLSITLTNVRLNRSQVRKMWNIRAGNYVKIIITDTGTGISKTVIDKIFDPFFTTKKSGKGTGLGLSTVRTIVRNHLGYVGVKSQKGEGTRFSIYLPAYRLRK